MKFPSKEELNEYTWALAKGGMKGFAAGSVISAGFYAYVNKNVPRFKTYGTFPKTFALIFSPMVIGVTAMEFASRDFEAERYGYNQRPANAIVINKEKEPSFAQRTLDACAEHKYKIIMGSWAASLAGSFWWVNRDKFMTKSQKIVQARMYAQGLTVILLLASVALSVGATSNIETPKKTQEDDWEKVVNEEVKREVAANLPLHLSERAAAK